MQGIKGFVFDLDGTLLNTYEHIVRAFEHTLQKHGIPAERDTIRSVIGMTLHQCYEVLAPNHYDHNILAETHHETQQTTEMYQLITVYEGLTYMLEVAHARGYKTAVVTNRSRESVDLIFNHVGLADTFQVVITKDEVSAPKPDPEGIKLAADLLKLETAALAMVGDTSIDIKAGKNAGVGATIAMSHGFGTLEELRESNPEHILSSFSQLRDLL